MTKIKEFLIKHRSLIITLILLQLFNVIIHNFSDKNSSSDTFDRIKELEISNNKLLISMDSVKQVNTFLDSRIYDLNTKIEYDSIMLINTKIELNKLVLKSNNIPNTVKKLNGYQVSNEINNYIIRYNKK